MKLDLNNFDQLMDEAMKVGQGPPDEASATELMRQMLKRIYERALRGELTHQLGYEKHDVAAHRSGNSRTWHESREIGEPPASFEISMIKIKTLAAPGCGGARLHRIFRKNK